MVDEAKLCSPLCSTFEAFVCDVQSGAVMENQALPVNKCQWQALQFSGQHTDLLSILLRRNGFTEIPKAVVNETGTDHQTVTMTFFCLFLV